MQNSQQMRYEVFIHNDDVMCFHMTQKVVVMGHHNFKDKLLIKRWWVGQKMNVTGGKLKDKKKTK
jgi:hypothetical protein